MQNDVKNVNKELLQYLNQLSCFMFKKEVKTPIQGPAYQMFNVRKVIKGIYTKENPFNIMESYSTYRSMSIRLTSLLKLNMSA